MALMHHVLMWLSVDIYVVEYLTLHLITVFSVGNGDGVLKNIRQIFEFYIVVV